MGKSFLNGLDDLFRVYARPPITEHLEYLPEAHEARYIKEGRSGDWTMLIVTEDSMEALGIKPGSRLRRDKGMPIEIVGQGHDTHYLGNYILYEKAIAWLKKIDEEAAAGKRFVSYELLYGPFSFNFNTKKLPKVSINHLFEVQKSAIEEIIRNNKKKITKK